MQSCSQRPSYTYPKKKVKGDAGPGNEIKAEATISVALRAIPYLFYHSTDKKIVSLATRLTLCLVVLFRQGPYTPQIFDLILLSDNSYQRICSTCISAESRWSVTSRYVIWIVCCTILISIIWSPKHLSRLDSVCLGINVVWKAK